MNESDNKVLDNIEIPKISLIKKSLLALVIAVSIFYTIIFPIEFGQDPLGTGELFGLPVLGSQATVENDFAKTDMSISNQYEFQKNTVDIIIPAKSGLEYKFKLSQFSNLTYQWTAEEPLYFDFHGEPKGDTSGYFESYTIANSDKMEGSMTVPFEGVHGWYWKNTSEDEVLVTLKTQGNYEVVGYIH